MKLSKIIRNIGISKDKPFTMSVGSMLGECRLKLHIYGEVDNVKCTICVDGNRVYSEYVSGKDYAIDMPIEVSMDRDVSILMDSNQVIDLIIFNLV